MHFEFTCNEMLFIIYIILSVISWNPCFTYIFDIFNMKKCVKKYQVVWLQYFLLLCVCACVCVLFCVFQRQLFGIEAPASAELTGWKKYFNSYTLQGRRNVIIHTLIHAQVASVIKLIHFLHMILLISFPFFKENEWSGKKKTFLLSLMGLKWLKLLHLATISLIKSMFLAWLVIFLIIWP